MSVADQHPNGGNWVLDALGQHERQQLLDRGTRVSLARGQSLGQPSAQLSDVHFPLSAVISLVQTTHAGEIHEVATVGRDGMVGLSLFLGTAAPPWDMHCQIPGDAVRVPAAVLGNVATATAASREVLGRYTEALLVQIARNAACNQLHSMVQRCSRWILLVHRQCGRDEFPLTQQSLAAMLAVRRATVSVTARALQEAGAISYHHGAMRVTNAAALNRLACDCYGAITEAHDALLRP